MVNDHDFVASLWRQISDMMERMDDDNAEVLDDAFDYKMIKKAILVLNSDKFVCDEAQKMHEWYEE